MNNGVLVSVLLNGGNALAGLPAFAYQAETNTLAAAFTTPPTARRQKTMDWAIRTLKGANKNAAAPWSKILGFWKVGADKQSSLKNWKSPGTFDLTEVTGGVAMTFTAHQDWAPGTGSYLETGIALNSLDPTKFGLFYHGTTSASTAGTDVGVIDGSANGLSLNLFNSGSAGASGRVGAANVNPFAGSWGSANALSGVCGASRQGSGSFKAYFNGSLRASNSQNNLTFASTQTIALMGLNNNGTRSAAARNQTCWAVLSDSLTDAEAEVLGNVMAQLDVEFRYGELDTYEAATAPASASYDVVVYGMTSQAYMAAYQAKRSGKTVCIVGGWRDRNLNGMSAGGLGYTDIFKEAASGGLPRWIWTQIQAIEGHTSTQFYMEPRHFDQVVRGLLDPRMTNGLDIPIYWSNGVSSVTKSSATGNPRITSMKTADGRTFTGKYFIDCSYEGDLMYVSGVPTRIGRESSAEFSENLAGYTGAQQTASFNVSQFLNHAGSAMAIDPYITPATPASGLLPWVAGGTYVAGTPALGDADALVQANNYRLTMVATGALAKTVDVTNPPPGYSALVYEPLGRQLAADPTLVLGDLIINNDLSSGGAKDWNNQNGQSLDYIGHGAEYLTASYAGRETVVQAHQNYIKGLLYFLGSATDGRVPTAVKNGFNGFGYSNTHYHRPHPNDDFNWPIAMYVREGRRLDNDFMLRQSDMEATDGFAPRSVKTIAAAAYTFDRHFVQVIADSGVPKIRLEGAIAKVAGGTNGITPLPMEILMPRKTDMENLLVTFGAAVTSVAFAPYRMELTAMQAAQSAGLIASQAIDNSNQAVQDVDYTTLRIALLASNTLSGETSPVLPVLN